MAGPNPAMTKGAGANDVAKKFPSNRVVHKNVWGLAGLPLEFPRLPSHIGTAARKHGWREERRRFCASRWEIGNFGLFQSVTRQVWTGGCGHAPRASFCVLWCAAPVQDFSPRIGAWA